eukprot:Opistho-2@90557
MNSEDELQADCGRLVLSHLRCSTRCDEVLIPNKLRWCAAMGARGIMPSAAAISIAVGYSSDGSSGINSACAKLKEIPFGHTQTVNCGWPLFFDPPAFTFELLTVGSPH